MEWHCEVHAVPCCPGKCPGDAAYVEVPDAIEPFVGWRAFRIQGVPASGLCIGGPLNGQCLPAEWPPASAFCDEDAPTKPPPYAIVSEEHHYVAERLFWFGELHLVWVFHELRGDYERCLELVLELAGDGALTTRALVSPSYAQVWERGWNDARCQSDALTVATMLYGAYHPPPAEGCGCGFYAAKEISLAARYLTGGEVCLARVEGAGKVIPGEHGWRAARARVVALVEAVGERPSNYADDENVRRLARQYGAEVEAVEIPWASFIPNVWAIQITGNTKKLAWALRRNSKRGSS